jgi:hypothetical protein
MSRAQGYSRHLESKPPSGTQNPAPNRLPDSRDLNRQHGLLESGSNLAKAHGHICAKCGAIYPCPDPAEGPCATAEERIGLCPGCDPQDGVEIVGRSEDGFEVIIPPSGKSRFRVQ